MENTVYRIFAQSSTNYILHILTEKVFLSLSKYVIMYFPANNVNYRLLYWGTEI